MAWIAGQTFVNPAAGTVLVDSGPLRGGYYRVQIIATANTGLEVLIQYRDAANLTTLKQKTLPVTLAYTPLLLNLELFINPNERIRVVQRQAVTTGEVEVSLVVQIPPIPGVQFWNAS